MNDRNAQWLIPVLLALAAAAALAYYWLRREPPTAPPPEPAVEAPREAAEPAGPRYPVPPPMPERRQAGELQPLPPLDQSDRYFAIALEDLFGADIGELLADEAVIEKFAATIDNLPRSHVAERIRPLGGVQGRFLVDGQDGSGAWTISPNNFRRYDGLVAMLAGADMEALMDVYLRFYPLFQAAYEALGYPEGYFNDRLVEVIDHLLATPEVAGPVELVRPHVLYEYADPELESLSAGQKLMLRIGLDHAATVKTFLRDLRARLVRFSE